MTLASCGLLKMINSTCLTAYTPGLISHYYGCPTDDGKMGIADKMETVLQVKQHNRHLKLRMECTIGATNCQVT